MSTNEETVMPEQEQIRLVSGYNDIFVGIACVITFVSLYALISEFLVNSLVVLVAAAVLGWFFVRRQRMRLTGIVIATFVAFAGLSLGFYFMFGTIPDSWNADNIEQTMLGERNIRLLLAVALLLAAALSVGFWIYARVPIAHGYAVLAVLLTILVLSLGSTLDDIATTRVIIVSFICGCLAEAYAIWWDIRDPARETVSTDVAFWTHVVAAPFLLQPLYWWAEVIAWSPTSEVVIGLCLFLLLLAFALVINRRALLIGAMLWVLAALVTIAEGAVAGLSMGVLLLIIAAFWNQVRKLIEPMLPEYVTRNFPLIVAD